MNATTATEVASLARLLRALDDLRRGADHGDPHALAAEAEAARLLLHRLRSGQTCYPDPPRRPLAGNG